MKSYKTLIAVAIVLFLLCIPTCSTYNSLVSLEESANASWSEVQNQYQRRFDLIPNLVETVKGYAAHESATLQGVTNARAGVTAPDTTAVMNAAQNALGATDPNTYANALSQLKREFSIYVNAVHEAYPDLKANQNFADLQAQLEGTENRVEKARHDYIGTVKDYNVKVKKFPSRIVAMIFGFEPMQQFEADQQAQTAPKVKF